MRPALPWSRFIAFAKPREIAGPGLRCPAPLFCIASALRGGIIANVASERDLTFSLSDVPVVDRRDGGAPFNRQPDELPRSYGTPLLVGIARDPQTCFAYWDIDWANAFGHSLPADRGVHLRVLDALGAEQLSLTVEPFAGSCYVNMEDSAAAYSLELGYYEPASIWNSIIVSEPILMPWSQPAEGPDFQLVNVPLHLSFQRLLEVFRGSHYDGPALAAALGELQNNGELMPELLGDVGWAGLKDDRTQWAEFDKHLGTNGDARRTWQKRLAAQAGSPGSSRSSS